MSNFNTVLPRVCILILTYNQRELTAACLASLAASNYPNAEIVVLDNASSDGTAEMVRREYLRVHFIQNGANLGYAEGNNVGLRYAMQSNAAYALVLNNDTIAAPDLVAQLVRAAEANPNAAFVGPLVYHFDEPGVIQSAGGLRTADWRFYHRGQNQEDRGQFQHLERVVWVSGCAIMARCAALEKVGLIDPAFFVYNEEVDWCVRAGALGYEILFVPGAHVWHKGVQRRYQPSPYVTYFSARNELLLLKKHHAGWRAMTSTWLRHLRTLLSWSVRPRWRDKRAHRDALARGLRDFLRGNFGAPAW
jgi:GT2 family glycosyltransferase